MSETSGVRREQDLQGWTIVPVPLEVQASLRNDDEEDRWDNVIRVRQTFQDLLEDIPDKDTRVIVLGGLGFLSDRENPTESFAQHFFDGIENAHDNEGIPRQERGDPVAPRSSVALSELPAPSDLSGVAFCYVVLDKNTPGLATYGVLDVTTGTRTEAPFPYGSTQQWPDEVPNNPWEL